MSAKSEKKKCPYQDIGGQAVMSLAGEMDL